MKFWDKCMQWFSKPMETFPDYEQTMLASEYKKRLIRDLKSGALPDNKKNGEALSPIETRYALHFREWVLTKGKKKDDDIMLAEDWNKFIKYLKRIYLK